MRYETKVLLVSILIGTLAGFVLVGVVAGGVTASPTNVTDNDVGRQYVDEVYNEPVDNLDGLAHPSVVKADGTYYLFFDSFNTSNGIRLAKSNDKTQFKDSELILDEGTIAPGEVIGVDAEVYDNKIYLVTTDRSDYNTVSWSANLSDNLSDPNSWNYHGEVLNASYYSNITSAMDPNLMIFPNNKSGSRAYIQVVGKKELASGGDYNLYSNDEFPAAGGDWNAEGELLASRQQNYMWPVEFVFGSGKTAMIHGLNSYTGPDNLSGTHLTISDSFVGSYQRTGQTAIPAKVTDDYGWNIEPDKLVDNGLYMYVASGNGGIYQTKEAIRLFEFDKSELLNPDYPNLNRSANSANVISIRDNLSVRKGSNGFDWYSGSIEAAPYIALDVDDYSNKTDANWTTEVRIDRSQSNVPYKDHMGVAALKNRDNVQLWGIWAGVSAFGYIKGDQVIGDTGSSLTNKYEYTTPVDIRIERNEKTNTTKYFYKNASESNFNLIKSTSQLKDVKPAVFYKDWAGSAMNESYHYWVTTWEGDVASTTEALLFVNLPDKDVVRYKNSTEFEVVGVSGTTDVTWTFPDGSQVTKNASEKVSYNFGTAGDNKVKATINSTSENATVRVIRKPDANLSIDPNPALEGQSVTFDGSSSDARETAARPPVSQLSVTASLRTWLPLSSSPRVYENGSLYTGTALNGSASYTTNSKDGSAIELGPRSQLYVDTQINWADNWTITQYIAPQSSSYGNHTLFVSEGGEGVGIRSGELVRLSDDASGNYESITTVSDKGYNLTVQHDGTGTFQYYLDDTFIGADTGYDVSKSDYLVIDPNSGYYSQSAGTVYDDWRAYQRVLTDNEVYSIGDYKSLSTVALNDLDYRINLDGQLLTTSSSTTVSDGFQVGDYNTNLTVQDSDGLVAEVTDILSVQDVVPPQIEKVSPSGRLSDRTVEIRADVSHPNISSSYAVDVVLVRTNLVTGNTSELINTTITSNKTLSYAATHDNTGIENYNVTREDFTYEWIAREPRQGLTSSESRDYSIPVPSVNFTDILPVGLQDSRTVTYSADVASSYDNSIRVKVTQYDYRDDKDSEPVNTTTTTPSTVSKTKSYSLNTTGVPADYYTRNLFTHVWSSEGFTSEINKFRLPGLIYVVDKQGVILNQNTTVGANESIDGVHRMEDVVNLSTDDTEVDVTSSGYYDRSLFVADYSRSKTVMLYDKNNSKTFNKTFNLSKVKSSINEISLSEAYLIAKTTESNVSYEVAHEPIGVDDKSTLLLEDNETYSLSIYDGENRRTLGEYTADKDTANEEQDLSATTVVYNESLPYRVDISNSKYENISKGYINYQFASNNDTITGLSVEVLRKNDSKLIYQDSASSEIDTYNATINVSAINKTHVLKWRAYDVQSDEEIGGQRVIVIAQKQVLEDLPQTYLTAVATVLLLILTGVIGMVSAPFALPVPVIAGGLFVAVGWLPISIVSVIQAGVIAALYFASRPDI